MLRREERSTKIREPRMSDRLRASENEKEAAYTAEFRDFAVVGRMSSRTANQGAVGDMLVRKGITNHLRINNLDFDCVS